MRLPKSTVAAVLGMAIIASSLAPAPAQAHKAGAFVGGLVAGAVIGGAVASASRPYYYKRPKVYYGPACGYYPYPPCGPVYAPPPPYYYPR
ncbi:hypothetical protein [Rhodoligotrophos defluvii]|uniref:hypothetical protein n=1 Tax=Rhodoligotrophos defluvii TaxID=2561934 RepID=UPI0010C977A7|nr:hypothetical protein [Rhodoligotrophos defluvii]